MVTAYDYPSGKVASEAGVELVLVGDSAAMTVLGHDSTVPVDDGRDADARPAPSTRGSTHPLVVADLPFMSYQVDDRDAMLNGRPRSSRRAAPTPSRWRAPGRRSTASSRSRGAGIPVMGHLGLTPQTATSLGGFKAQGRTADAALELLSTTRSRSRRPAPSRSCSSACPRRSRGRHGAPHDPRPSASVRAPAATGRCWSTTTCWARRPRRRAS